MSKFVSRFLCFIVSLSLLTASACGNGDTDSSSADSSAPSDVVQGAQREVEAVVQNATDNVEFSQLALGKVKAESWLKNQLLLQAEEVTKQFENLSPDCKSEGDDRSGWLGGSGESWERGTYYVRGLITTAYVLDDAEMKAQAQKWIDWTLESQAESGAFGPFADNTAKLDYWPLMPMLIALEYYYDATGDERVIPFLEKYFEWQAQALRKQALSSWARVRGGDNIFAVLWLYEHTGNEELIRLCKILYSQTWDWEEAYDKEAWLETYHIVNAQQSFKLFPVMYAVTGDEKYLDLYYKGIENIYMASGRQDGMSNGDENSRGIDAVFGSETCAVVERMLCDEIALYLLRDATIADHLELITYNALPQQLLPDGKGQVYFTMQNQVMANLGIHGFTSDGGDRSVYGLPGGFPCCVHNYQMGWPMFIASMWMGTSDNGLAVGAYGPNTVSATVGNGTSLTIAQTTNYPYEDTVTLTLTSDKTDTYPIYVRIPEWCKNATVLVNGHAVEAEFVSGEYAKLTAAWESGDVITLTFPAEITATLTDNNSVSIRRGAVLFALEIGEEWKKVSHDPNGWNQSRKYPSYNITPTTDWNYALENFNFDDVASNFTLTRNEISDDMRYQLADVPMVLEAKAKTVVDWTLNEKYNIAGDTPVSPVAEDRLGKDTVTVRLVPYAHTRLRITLIPWTGVAQPIVPSSVSSDKITFGSVIVPQEVNTALTGVPSFKYTIDLKYDSSVDLPVTVYMNRTEAMKLTLTKGANTVSFDADLLGTDRHNIIEFVADGDATVPEDFKAEMSITVISDGRARYEAEKARLTGSCKNNTTHVASIDSIGSSLTYTDLVAVKDGEYTLRFYYAAPLGLATHTIYIDGAKVGTVKYNENGKSLGWGQFSNNIYADFKLNLTEGTHTIRIEKTADDRGAAELDAFDIIPS